MDLLKQCQQWFEQNECDEQNRQEEQPTNKANGNRKKLGRLKGAKTIAR